ncbi:hypothetical protein Franean1_5350 [Parafrankia sp. EAN1pec]|nr:hypothetical protein Franean1_5350 [Frankia sp. EAN1pec]
MVLLLHGAFYAATDGVLMAAAAVSVPVPLRSSGLALVQTGQASTSTSGASRSPKIITSTPRWALAADVSGPRGRAGEDGDHGAGERRAHKPTLTRTGPD